MTLQLLWDMWDQPACPSALGTTVFMACIRVALVNKMIHVSSVQLCNTSSVSSSVTTNLTPLYHPLHPLPWQRPSCVSLLVPWWTQFRFWYFQRNKLITKTNTSLTRLSWQNIKTEFATTKFGTSSPGLWDKHERPGTGPQGIVTPVSLPSHPGLWPTGREGTGRDTPSLTIVNTLLFHLTPMCGFENLAGP